MIICPEHGEFEQAAWNHAAGIGCPDCVRGELSEEQSHIHQRTRTRTWRALQDGQLDSIGECEVCGSMDTVQAHHVSYDRLKLLGQPYMQFYDVKYS